MGTFVQVSSGRLHSCAVSAPTPYALGEVVCWGSDSHGQSHDDLPIDANSLAFPGLDEHIVEVVAGGYHTCARSDRWQTYCWGMNTYGALGDALGVVPSPNDPDLTWWGGTAPRDLAAGNWGSCMVRQPNGNPNEDEELMCWGWPFDTTYPAPGDVPQQVSVGSSHACFIDDDDLVQCWGSVSYGKSDVPEIDQCPGTLEPIDPPFPLPLPLPWP